MMMSSNNKPGRGDGAETVTDPRSRRVIRVLLPALFIIGSLPLLNLAVFNAWAGGGPPSSRPEGHARWSDIYLAVWGFCILFAGLSVYLLRPNDVKSHGSALKPKSPSAQGPKVADVSRELT